MQSSKKHSIIKWSRVDVQVSVIIAVVVICSFVCVYLFNYQITYREMMDSLQERSNSIYEFIEASLDKSTFYDIASSSDVDESSDAAYEAYHEMKAAMEDVKAATGVRYLYTAKRASDGSLIYIVDGLPSSSEDFRNPGDAIEHEIVPEMERALNNEIVYPSDIKSTDWGEIFVTYYPVHDNDVVVGVVGIEFDAERQFETFRTVRIGTPLIGLAFCFVAVVVSVLLFRRISNPAYRDLSNTDYLTGLKSRNAFEVDLNNWNRDGGPIAGVIAVDLDYLKTVNDEFGHSAGDAFIKKAAAIVAARCGEAGPVYRIGGDEFVVCCFELDDEAAQTMVAQMHADCQNVEVEGRPISLSAGWAIREEGEDVRSLCRRADKHMYAEKAEARRA